MTAAKPPKRPAAKKVPAKKAPIVGKREAAKVQSITPKVERFIEEYLIDLNATRAYMRSHPGAKESTARVESCRLLANPAVQERIVAARKQASERLNITREGLLAHLWGIATADPRELMEYVVTCCRHCHGVAFFKQWIDEAEFKAAVAEAKERHLKAVAEHRAGDGPKPQLILPTDIGGYGFDHKADPNPDCPRCQGEGLGRPVFKDTRRLSPGAAALFAGVKQTKEGLEFKLHSKLDAAEKIAKHLGLYEKDNEQKAGTLAGLLGQLARSALPVAAKPSDGDDT